MADRRLDLGAVEPRRAVDSAVADEDDVVVVREPARPGEFHVGDAGAAFEAEDRLRRVVRPCTDASHRQGDQPRLRVGPVLGHDECPAVGSVAAVLGRVVAALQRQVAGLRTCGHGDGRRRARIGGRPARRRRAAISASATIRPGVKARPGAPIGLLPSLPVVPVLGVSMRVIACPFLLRVGLERGPERTLTSRSLGRCRLSQSLATALSSARVCVRVMEGVQRESPGNRNAEKAVVALVDDINTDVVRTRVPEEGDLEAVLLTVGEFFEAAVRHGEFLSVMGLAIHSPIMRPQAHQSRPGEPHS